MLAVEGHTPLTDAAASEQSSRFIRTRSVNTYASRLESDTWTIYTRRADSQHELHAITTKQIFDVTLRAFSHLNESSYAWPLNVLRWSI